MALRKKKDRPVAVSPTRHQSDFPLYDSAPFTRSGENGTLRRRTPVAPKTASAIAAATGRIDGSPAPVGAISGRLISTTFTSRGVSVMSRIGQVNQSTLVTALRSKVTSSHNVRLTP